MKVKLGARSLATIKPKAQPYEVRDVELQGLLLRVQPSGVMTYFFDLKRPDGRRSRIKIGRAPAVSVAQARDEARKIIGERVTGADPIQTRRVEKTLTLKHFIAEKYGPWVVANRKSGQATLHQLERFDEFMDLRLTDISTWKVDAWRTKRRKGGTQPATINRNVVALKAAIAKAVEWGIIEVHPLLKIKPYRVDSSQKIRFLGADEETRLRAALDAREARLREERQRYNLWRTDRHLPEYPDLTACAFADHLKPMVLLSINTGMRRGELFSLTWEHVDLSRKTLTIVGATAKSGKTRHIPLNQEALAVLEGWRGQSEGLGLVFTSHDGKRFDNVNTSWESVLRAAKISTFRWHDQRHHFASQLVMLGVDLNTVRELLGHSDIKMTLRYAHLAPHVKADAVAKLDGPVAGGSNADKADNLLKISG